MYRGRHSLKVERHILLVKVATWQECNVIAELVGDSNNPHNQLFLVVVEEEMCNKNVALSISNLFPETNFLKIHENFNWEHREHNNVKW